MSGFLKKFTNEEYNSKESIRNTRLDTNVPLHPTLENDMEAHEAEILETTNSALEEDKQELINISSEELEKNALPTENNLNIFQTSNTKDEKLVLDREKIKKRKIKICISTLLFCLFCSACYMFYIKANTITVPSFALEKNINDVEVWVAKNKIQLDYTSEYSVKADEGIVISQSKKSGQSIQKGTTFHVIVSKGANPDEKVKLPNFEKMNLTKIESWKQKNKANNVSIEKVYNAEISNGSFISMAFKTDGIDATNYRRKDKLNITVSKGKEVFEKNISLPDFKNKSKGEVETWASEKEVTIAFSEQASKTVVEGNVISQDIPAKTKIAKNDTVNIIVSKGQVFNVPNFYGLDEAQATIEAAKANVTITVVKYYHNQVGAGQLVSQSLPSGSEVNSENIVLVYSSGKPYIANFDGQDLYVLIQSLNEMNSSGAKITYEIQEVDSVDPKGIIVNTSIKASFVNTGSNVVIYISKG